MVPRSRPNIDDVHELPERILFAAAAAALILISVLLATALVSGAGDQGHDLATAPSGALTVVARWPAAAYGMLALLSATLAAGWLGYRRARRAAAYVRQRGSLVDGTGDDRAWQPVPRRHAPGFEGMPGRATDRRGLKGLALAAAATTVALLVLAPLGQSLRATPATAHLTLDRAGRIRVEDAVAVDLAAALRRLDVAPDAVLSLTVDPDVTFATLQRTVREVRRLGHQRILVQALTDPDER